MQPLSIEAQARLAAFRRAESPGPEVAERGLAALERRLAEPPLRSRRAALSIAAAVLALAAGIVLALGWARAPSAELEDSAVAAPFQSGEGEGRETVAPGRKVQSGDRPVDASEAVAAAVAPDGAAEPETSVSKEDAPNPTKREPRPGGRRARATADELAEEVRLLREAKLAEPARRLELLDELARRFPNGALAAERMLLTIEARCALGEREVARVMAQQFTRRFPNSSLAARAAKVCAEGAQGGAATP